MATVSTSPERAEIDLALQQRLGDLRRRWLTVGTLNAVVCGLLAAGAVLLFAAWLDLLWELSSDMRWLSVRLAVAAGALTIVAVVWFSHRAGNRRALARRMDTAGETGGQILSALDLIQYPVRSSELSRGLSAMAVERAGMVSQEVPGWKVVPLRRTKIACAVFVVTAVVVAAIRLFMPELAQAQWLRFSDPYGDHPPYSSISWSIDPGDTEVVYASGLDIYATTEGPAVDQAHLVLEYDEAAVTDAGQGELRADDSTPPRDEAGEGDSDERIEELPMFREADGRWRAVLVRVTEPATYYVRSGRARSVKHRIGVITVPRLEEVRFRVTPPSYTQLGPYEGPLPEGGLSGLPGAHVEVFAKSNRPLAGGTLIIEGEGQRREIALQPSESESAEVTTEFEIQQAGKFKLHVVDVQGQSSRESFGGAIHLLDDHRPFVRMMQPRSRSYATPNIRLPVVMSAEDDYGISRLAVFRSLNDSRALPQDAGVSGFPRRTDERLAMPLSTYGLEPGDQIKLYGRVEDNDPLQTKGSESDIVTVIIISEEDYNRMLQRREGLRSLLSKYREAQRRMANLTEAKKGLRKKMKELKKEGKEIPEELREELRRVSDQFRDEIEQLQRLTKNETSLDLEKSLAERLKRLTRKLEKQASRMKDLADDMKMTRQDMESALEEMLSDLEEERKAYEEQVMLPLDMLERVYPMIEDQARFIQLVRRQRALERRLVSLKGRDKEDDPAIKRRMRDFEDEQARIREGLVQLLDDIDNHVTELPEDEALDLLRESAIEFVEQVRSSGAIEAMSEAELALTEFSGTRGYAKAKEAAEILEQFVSKAQQMAGQGAAACKLKFAPGLGGIELGETIEQLLAGLGLLPGQMGAGGSGSGYSQRRSSLDNVGLYGNNPRRDDAREGSGSGESDAAAAARRLATDDDARTSNIGPDGELRASGGGEADVPVRYRRRVGAYFRRIADDLGE